MLVPTDSPLQVSSAHAVEREYRVLKALADTPVPVPEVYLLCEDSSVLGTPFYIMQFVRGRVFMDPALPGINDPAERTAMYSSAVNVLRSIHQVDLGATGLQDFSGSGSRSGRAGSGPRAGYFPRQVASLTRVSAKQAEDAGEVSGLLELAKELKRHADSIPDVMSLVHGDFRVDNL